MHRVTTNGSELGAALRQLRLDAALTQAQLADLAGVSLRWVVQFESGKTPGAELSKVFGVFAAVGRGLSPAALPQPDQSEAELLQLLAERRG